MLPHDYFEQLHQREAREQEWRWLNESLRARRPARQNWFQALWQRWHGEE